MININVILYDNFTALDVFGPVEVLSDIEDSQIHFLSLKGGIIKNRQSIRIETEPVTSITKGGILLIPGGFGSRTEVNNEVFINVLRDIAISAEYVLCVCTGSALLAKTGILDGRKATSNKRAFEWVKSCGTQVQWIREARWIVDGNFYTSAGVSAGIDMTLGFIADIFGKEKSMDICRRLEYHWNFDNIFKSFKEEAV